MFRLKRFLAGPDMVTNSDGDTTGRCKFKIPIIINKKYKKGGPSEDMAFT